MYILGVFLAVPRISLQIQNVFTNFEYIIDKTILMKIVWLVKYLKKQKSEFIIESGEQFLEDFDSHNYLNYIFQLNKKGSKYLAQCTLWIQSLAFLTFDVIHFWCDTRQASVAELNSWSDGGSVKRGKGSEKNKIFAFDHFIKHCIPVGWWPE